MKEKIRITTEEIRNRAIEIIRNLPLDVVHSVDIKEYKLNRSVEHNQYYWKMLTTISNDIGETKEELHERYKEKYLINIYERDNEDFAEMIQSIRAVYANGMKIEAMALRKQIIALTTTTTATVAQMAEYLEEILKHAANLGIRLPYFEG